MDLSKAFDTEDHNMLLKKLYNMGFRGICQELIKSYLQNRTQCVKVNDTKIQPVKTNLGVPQG